MLTKQEILDYLRQHHEEFRRDFCIESIGLCGSYARGDQLPDSDIDIVVEMTEPNFFLRMDFAQHLSKVFGREVQVISRFGLRTMIWESIAEDVIYV